MRCCIHTPQFGKNLNSMGTLVKNKRIFQKGYNNFHTGRYYLAKRHRGRGFGSAFLGLARFLIPLLQSGYTAIKNEAFSAGKDILRDIRDKQLEKIVKKRGEEAVQNLKEKAINKIDSMMMSGQGMRMRKKDKKSIKRRNVEKTKHIVKNTKRKRTSHSAAPQNKINIEEIFG